MSLQNITKHLTELGIDYHSSNDKTIKVAGWQKSNTKVGNLKDIHNFAGLIFKEEGIFIQDKMLVCIDIDAKAVYGNTSEEQTELFKTVATILAVDSFYQGIEKTMNGGYHIFLLIEPKEALTLKNSSVVIEYFTDEKGVKKAKKEIEIFVNGRYIVNAPSKGYTALQGEHIDFTKLKTVNFEQIEQLDTLACEIKIDKNFEEVNYNTANTDTYVNKSFTIIPELKKFKNGEWLGYNFTKDEIMRFFICLNQEEEFLNIIKENWIQYYNNWKEFPIKYINATEGNRSPSKNSKHIEWLKKIGALKSISKKDALKDDMFAIFEKIAGKTTIKLGDSTFIYNGRSYEWLNPLEYDVCIYKEYYDKHKKLLNKEEVSELVHHFKMYLRTHAIDYNPADKTKKVEVVPLAFNNGTLYISEKETIFKENYWSADDKCFVEFIIDYSEDYTYSYFTDWVEARFGTTEKKEFFQMCIGDLFATEATTDIHAYFWGGAGIGKSTISSLLQNITSKGTVDFMKLDKIKDKFSRVKTLRTPILIADEASERNIPESEYKSSISREADDYEMKNIQNFNGQPIAKFLTFANILPNIKMDSGVKRRLCVLEVSDTKIHTDLSELEFAEKLGACKNEIVAFIVEGIKKCFHAKWRLSHYYKKYFAEEKRNTIEANDSFSYFVDKCFLRSHNPEKKEDFVLAMDAFKVYNQFLNTLEGTAMHRMTVTKFGTKIKELGFDTKKIKKDSKVVRIYCGILHTEKSRNLLENHVEN